MKIEPKEITIDSDSGKEIASFGYYDGIEYAKQNNLNQTTEFKDVFNKTHFIVYCGDVIVSVNKTDYPNIIRRIS